MKKNDFTSKMTSKDYLKYALLTLIAEKSIYKITVKELCDRANVNRSTFYSYYEDLNALYDKLMSEAEVGLVDAVTNNNTNQDLILVKDKAFQCYIQWFTHVHDHYDIFNMFLSENGPSIFRIRLYSQGIQWYTQLLKPIMHRFEDKISIDVLANYIVSAHMGLLLFYVGSNMKYSPEYMANQLTLLTFSGPFSILGLFKDT